SWDVVVVDEAHHGAARRALDRLRDARHRLLLTATPFQLDMTELHSLTRHLVADAAPAHKVLKRGAVREYAKLADSAFDDANAPTPTIQQRRAAQRVLGQLVACSHVGRQKRHYFAIRSDGQCEQVSPPIDLDSEHGISDVFERAIVPGEAFQE